MQIDHLIKVRDNKVEQHSPVFLGHQDKPAKHDKRLAPPIVIHKTQIKHAQQPFHAQDVPEYLSFFERH